MTELGSLLAILNPFGTPHFQFSLTNQDRDRCRLVSDVDSAFCCNLGQLQNVSDIRVSVQLDAEHLFCNAWLNSQWNVASGVVWYVERKLRCGTSLSLHLDLPMSQFLLALATKATLHHTLRVPYSPNVGME
jgi:hypothetical protein